MYPFIICVSFIHIWIQNIYVLYSRSLVVTYLKKYEGPAYLGYFMFANSFKGFALFLLVYLHFIILDFYILRVSIFDIFCCTVFLDH